MNGSMTTLTFGDCLEGLRTLPAESHHALCTDPPFTAAGGSTNGRNSRADTQFFESWLRQVVTEACRVLRPDGCGFVFCDWRTIGVVESAFAASGSRMASSKAWRVSQALVWDRESIGLGSPFRNGFEMIAFVRGPDYRSCLPKDIGNVIRHRYPYGRHEFHGAEKPVELVAKLIGLAQVPAGGLVLDPFAGSGTTLVAAAGAGVSATGFEIELDTYEVARTRLVEAGVRVDPSAAVREARLAAGRCPECGAEVEWSLRSSRVGDSASARCVYSGYAFLSGQQALAFDAGRRCSWAGRVVRAPGGLSRLTEVSIDR